MSSPNPYSTAPGLTFVGHVSIDEIKNIRGTKTQPGGGALYSATAAKIQNGDVALVSAVGKDYPFRACFSGIDSTCIKSLNMPTTRFHIRYDNNWEAEYIKANIGAGARINASQILSRLLKPRSIIHLSPMKPHKITRIVSDLRSRAPDVRLSISTWIGYMKTRKERQTLTKLASQVDFFMLNEFEAKALAQTSSLSLALERIRTRNLIVTMGKLGAIVGGVDSDPQMVPALANPSGTIVDTTGAGDTWNGAFLASYRTTNDMMKAVTAASIISSIKCSQWGFEAIRKLRFKKPSDAVEYVLALKEGNMQKRITDYSQSHKPHDNSIGG